MDAVNLPDLSKSQIFSAIDSKIERVAVPEWGGCVYVRSLSAFEVDSWESSLAGDGNPDTRAKRYANVRAQFCAMAMCTKDGGPFTDPTDVGDLAKKSSAALQRVYKAAKRLSGMGDDLDKAIEKNSEPGPSGDAGSNSPTQPDTK